jgi:hypothetical protein
LVIRTAPGEGPRRDMAAQRDISGQIVVRGTDWCVASTVTVHPSIARGTVIVEGVLVSWSPILALRSSP